LSGLWRAGFGDAADDFWALRAGLLKTFFGGRRAAREVLFPAYKYIGLAREINWFEKARLWRRFEGKLSSFRMLLLK
jgi:hypothetical protein